MNGSIRGRWLVVGVIFVGAVIEVVPAWGQSPAKRPNVLLIICDDLNDSVARMGGHPQAKTPNIDRLMDQGIRFTNAHCALALCGPARAAMLSGLYPSTTGLYDNKTPWWLVPKLRQGKGMLQYFKDHGYTLYGTGKIQHNGHEDWAVWKGNDGVTRFGVRPDFGPWPGGGFGRLRSHPSMPSPISKRAWDSFAPLSDVPRFAQDEVNNGLVGQGWWLSDNRPFRYKSPDDRDPMPDERSARWAADQLLNHIDRKEPFFMVVGFNRPHAPFYAPKKYFDMFPPQSLELPPYRQDDLADCAKVLAEVTSPADWGRSVYDRVIEAGGVPMWKQWLQAYLACVAFVDDQLGVVLDALGQSDLAENTIIVFTSDHGYHMGEKDHMFKTTIWEEATRVPLVVVAGGVARAGTECDRPVSHVDLFPTLIDLCRLPEGPNKNSAAPPLDGHSMRPLMADPAGGTWDGPSVALSAISGDDVFRVGQVVRQHFTVRSRHWRYTLCRNGEEELYDHRNDPHEWTNLAAEPEHAGTKASLHSELLRLTGR